MEPEFVMTKTLAKPVSVAVAGNPNAGKTTIFNALTGARQRVGNYPGVTVEWKQGSYKRGDLHLEIFDLPGTYSLTAYSEEELVARDFLLSSAPDVVVAVVDASNLERNLFLVTELLEIGRPLVIALNMTDVARDRGLTIDIARLADKLGVPVVPTIGNKSEGMTDLVRAINAVAVSQTDRPATGGICGEATPDPANLAAVHPALGHAMVDYGPPIEEGLTRIADRLPEHDAQRWQAVKLLAGDPKVIEGIAEPGARETIEAVAAGFAEGNEEDPDTLLARRRYEFIEKLCRDVVHAPSHRQVTVSDKIDRVAMRPIWGVPIFLTLMYVVFTLTFSLGSPLMDIIDSGFGHLGDFITGLWPAGSESPLKSLLVDGVIGGVGGVLVFLPNIVLLFMAIAILEGTGYMARAAFVMDRFMSKVGLHGKSFIPLLIGFGCTVPAIMATRTLETRRDRLITMMVLPLMSCGARLPIYALMIPAFFAPKWQGPILWIIYVVGILLALGGAQLLRATMFRGETTPFLMELPPYRMPTAISLIVQMWTRSWLYMKKAGTLILGAAVILWFLASFPTPPEDYVLPVGFDGTTLDQAVPLSEIEDESLAQAAAMAYSISGRIGRALEPFLSPLGFDWRIGTAMVGATAAKEVFVAQMGIVFAVGEADEESDFLRLKLRDRYSQLVGFCIMLFAMISTPCIATFAITRQEAGSIKWAFAQYFGLTAVAWIVTFVVYRMGLLVGWGVT
jgi:ferrous iron transport protein B